MRLLLVGLESSEREAGAGCQKTGKIADSPLFAFAELLARSRLSNCELAEPHFKLSPPYECIARQLKQSPIDREIPKEEPEYDHMEESDLKLYVELHDSRCPNYHYRQTAEAALWIEITHRLFM